MSIPYLGLCRREIVSIIQDQVAGIDQAGTTVVERHPLLRRRAARALEDVEESQLLRVQLLYDIIECLLRVLVAEIIESRYRRQAQAGAFIADFGAHGIQHFQQQARTLLLAATV